MSQLSERLYLLEQKQRIKELEHEKQKKQMETLEKKKIQKAERKQYEKDLLLACKKDLKNIFEKDFSLQGTQAKFNFYNISTRENIIKSIATSEQEGDYLETNYNKILNEIIQKYKLNEEYKNEQQKEITRQYVEKMTPIWEALHKKKKKQENIFTFFKFLFIIIKWFFMILFGWIYLLLKLICTLAGI